MGMRLSLAGDELGAAQVNHLGGDGDGDLLGVLGLDGDTDRQVQLVDLLLRKPPAPSGRAQRRSCGASQAAR